MFDRRSWIERYLSQIGIAMVGVGLILAVLGGASQFPMNAWDIRGQTDTFIQGLFIAGRIGYDLGFLLVGTGALVFCFGKFIERSFVTIVGFERSKPDDLVVKGPDADNIVWIGRRFANSIEAEQTAAAFRERFRAAA